jgi:hypothetical protein
MLFAILALLKMQYSVQQQTIIFDTHMLLTSLIIPYSSAHLQVAKWTILKIAPITKTFQGNIFHHSNGSTVQNASATCTTHSTIWATMHLILWFMLGSRNYIPTNNPLYVDDIYFTHHSPARLPHPHTYLNYHTTP